MNGSCIQSLSTFSCSFHSHNEAPCFLAGTQLLTVSGYVAVEALREGDRIVTSDGGTRPIVWIGHRRIDDAAHPHPERVRPIRLRRDAVADGVPYRDLLVSPDHAILVDGALICARQLVNGATILQDDGFRSVHYFHIELDRHDIVLAEGMPSESYLDTGNRSMFANGGGPVALHPSLDSDCGRADVRSCLDLATDPTVVEPVWQRLRDRSVALGFAVAAPSVTRDPELLLEADGARLRPILAQDGRHVFVLDRPASTVRLISRAGRPADSRPWLDDRRCLGVLVRRILFDDGTERSEIPVDHPALAQGWWETEASGPMLQRWTDGAATLALALPAGTLELQIAGEMLFAAASAGQGGMPQAA